MPGLARRATEILSDRGLAALASETRSYLSRKADDAVRWTLWRAFDDHTEAYRRWMNYKLRTRGAKRAVGGFELGIGALQFDYLVAEGLRPGHRLLDLGCGCLRAGRFFLDYLDPGHYTGMDINPNVIEEGKALVGAERLARKDPTFVVNDDLRFEEFDGTFDFVIAQSVFTHLPRSEVRECLTHVSRVLDEDSAFYFTFFDRDRQPGNPDNVTGFQYAETELAAMAADADLAIRFVDADRFPHPRGQRMARDEPAPARTPPAASPEPVRGPGSAPRGPALPP